MNKAIAADQIHARDEIIDSAGAVPAPNKAYIQRPS
jgi:hypothetical protein